MKVLFNADDFGLTKGVTDGIIKAHTHGVVGATTMIMNGLAVDYAVAQAKKHPTLKVGIHLVLTWGKPIHNDVPALVNQTGQFIYKNTYANMPAPDTLQVKKEWRAQIEAFLATGLRLHHIDSHHHIHGWAPLKEIVIQLAETYQIPVRYTASLKDEPDILLTENVALDFYGENVDENIFTTLQKYDVNRLEVMTHPAYVDNDLRTVSSYVEKREQELDILCRLEVPGWATLL